MASADEECKLEPELQNSTHRRFWHEPWLAAIDSALKRFKMQIESDKTLPTNWELRKFLDDMCSNFTHLDPIFVRAYCQSPTDMTLLYALSESDKLDSTKLRSILRETPNQQHSLLQIAIEYSLWRSVALMLAFGATSGTGSTVEQVVASINLDNISREEQDWLDLSTLVTDSNEPCYFTNKNEGDPSAWACGFLLDLLQARAPGLDTTSPSSTLSSWFHVPSTNGLIILAIIVSLRDWETALWSLPTLFYNQFRNSNITSGDPYLNSRKARYWSSNEANITIVAFPTLMTTTLKQHYERRGEFETMRDKMSTRVTESVSPECTFHFERTLDETYFPGLTDTDFEERNADQVISSGYPKDPSRRPIIIVPQLWLWQYQDVLISAHSVPRRSEYFFSLGQAEGNGKCESRVPHLMDQTKSRKVAMAVLIARYVRSFGKEGLTLPEKTEAKVEPEASGTANNKTKGDDEHKNEVPPVLDLFERQVVHILSEVKRYTIETPRKRIIYAKEEAFHHQLSDCRSELAMIKHVLGEQESIITQFQDDLIRESEVMAKEGSGDEQVIRDFKHAVFRLDGALAALKEYTQRIIKIEGDAERVEKNVQDLLNLKRTFASVQDSHASVLLGLAAFAFAIVTIVFAPLAFLTAFFALNVQGFDRLRISKPEPKETPLSASTGLDGNIIAIEAKDGPVYHGGKMAGMLVGSVLTTVLVTGTLVFLLMKHTGIELSDLRFDKQPERDAINSKKDKKEELEDVKPRSWAAWSSVRRAVNSSTSYVKKRKPLSKGPKNGVKRDGALTGPAELCTPLEDLEAQRETTRESAIVSRA